MFQDHGLRHEWIVLIAGGTRAQTETQNDDGRGGARDEGCHPVLRRVDLGLDVLRGTEQRHQSKVRGQTDHHAATEASKALEQPVRIHDDPGETVMQCTTPNLQHSSERRNVGDKNIDKINIMESEGMSAPS